MPTTRIHVNKSVIASNIKHGTCEPPITVKTYKDNRYCHEVEILDNDGNVVARVVHSSKPLSCGARVWIETHNEVRVIDGQPPKRARKK